MMMSGAGRTGRRVWILPALGALWALSSVAAADRISCFATIPPAADLVERIGGDAVKVHVLVPAGQNPHMFSPKPRTMVNLARSRIYFAVGLPFEDRIIKKVGSTDADLTIVRLDKGIQKREMEDDHGGHGHQHEEHGHEEDEHDGGSAHEAGHGDHGHDGHAHHGHHENRHGLDPHIWMSPVNAIRMARAIANALAEKDPERAELYGENLEELEAEVRTVHEQIDEVLKPFRGRSFYVFHPAFGYFGDTYGLKERAVEISGRAPTPRELRNLIHRAKKEGVRILFVQPQFDAASARTIARAIDGSVVRLDPLSKDLLKNFQTIARKLRSSFVNE